MEITPLKELALSMLQSHKLSPSLSTESWNRLAAVEGVQQFLARTDKQLMPQFLLEQAREKSRAEHLSQLLSACAEKSIFPVLFKGTALAYSVYADPSLRHRVDTDFLVPQEQIPQLKKIFASLGYQAGLVSGENTLFYQISFYKEDKPWDQRICFDVHWKFSNRRRYADLFTHASLQKEKIPLPLLGPLAFAPCLGNSLLIACLHPAMHHYGEAPLIWLFDIYLLTQKMHATDEVAFLQILKANNLAEVCLTTLKMAGIYFPSVRIQRLISEVELIRATNPISTPSLSNWTQVFLDDLRSSQNWSERLEILQQVACPDPKYMRSAFFLEHISERRFQMYLPFLYMVRAIRGFLKLVRRKM